MALKRISGRGFVKFVEVEDEPVKTPSPKKSTRKKPKKSKKVEVPIVSETKVKEDWQEDGFPKEEHAEPEQAGS